METIATQNGGIISRYTYDAFGKVVEQTEGAYSCINADVHLSVQEGQAKAAQKQAELNAKDGPTHIKVDNPGNDGGKTSLSDLLVHG